MVETEFKTRLTLELKFLAMMYVDLMGGKGLILTSLQGLQLDGQERKFQAGSLREGGDDELSLLLEPLDAQPVEKETQNPECSHFLRTLICCGLNANKETMTINSPKHELLYKE